MSEILKKWDAICKDATIKFNTNDTVVFNYAVVKIVGRGNDPILWNEALSAGGSIQRSENCFYVEYEELRSVTDFVSGGRGRVYFGKNQPGELIVGGKAIVLFISYPQSENGSSIQPVSVLHLKSGKSFGINAFEQFFKSHNLSDVLSVKKDASVMKVKNEPITVSGIMWIVGITFVIFMASSDNHPTVWLTIWGVFLLFAAFRRNSKFVTLKDFLLRNSTTVLQLMSKDAISLWQELEAKQGA